MKRTRKWQKRGLCFCPSGEMDWMLSHAAVPIAENIGGSYYKIYFSTRNAFNRSYTGYVVIDIHRPNKILDRSHQPVLSPGKLGELPFLWKTNVSSWLTVTCLNAR